MRITTMTLAAILAAGTALAPAMAQTSQPTTRNAPSQGGINTPSAPGTPTGTERTGSSMPNAPATSAVPGGGSAERGPPSGTQSDQLRSGTGQVRPGTPAPGGQSR